jgi:hypothetical protein
MRYHSEKRLRSSLEIGYPREPSPDLASEGQIISYERHPAPDQNDLRQDRDQ